MKHKKQLLSFCAALFAALPVLSAQEKMQQLPLEEVVLYSSGVGMFVHSGKVTGDVQITLSLDNDQLNDVLKSLLLLSEKGLTIKAVNYPGKIPLNDRLKYARIAIQHCNDFVSLLSQLRGVDFKVTGHGEDSFTGKFVGSSTLAGKDKTEIYLDFIVGDEMRRINYGEIKSVTPADESLRKDIQNTLKTMADEAGNALKTMRVCVSSPDKERLLHLGYVIAAPVWKASYRMILPEKPEGKAMLQAWALIENPTATPWKDVKVSLVSGKVSSFVQDLYTSLYVSRPEVRNDVTAAPVHQFSSATPTAEDTVPVEYKSMNLAGATPENARMGMFRKSKAARGNLSVAESAAAASGATSSAGAFCRFDLPLRVTLGSRESAMVELMTLTPETKRVSIYNKKLDAIHPLNAVYFTNATKFLLPGGPVTVVMQDGTYAGDASMPNVVAGTKQLLSFGLDQEVEVSGESGNDRESRKISRIYLQNNYLEVVTRSRVYTTYTVRNKAMYPRTVIVEHPKHNGCELSSDSVKPMEENLSERRFEVKLQPDKETSITVREEYDSHVSYSLDPDRIHMINTAFTGMELPEKDKEFIGKLVDLSKSLTARKDEIKDLDRKYRDLNNTHSRIRSTYDTITNQGYRTQLLKRLQELDEQIFTVYDQQEKAIAAQKQLEKDIAALIEKKKKD